MPPEAPKKAQETLKVASKAKVAPQPQKAVQSEMRAFITGYNTVPAQTDSTPCIAAGGNICGRMDTAACPSWIPLKTWVEIRGKNYQCMDRTHSKFNGRFDISCDKDMACPNRHTGYTQVRILQ